MKKENKNLAKSRSAIQSKIIEAGVKNLQEFGYPHCNKDNILTDIVYKRFFISMLKENLGMGYDSDMKALLEECGHKDGKIKSK